MPYIDSGRANLVICLYCDNTCYQCVDDVDEFNILNHYSQTTTSAIL